MIREYDTPPSNVDAESLIWEEIRPDLPATKDQRIIGFLALAILRLVEERKDGGHP